MEHMKYEPVLAPWRAVKINNELQPVISGPCYCVLEVG